MSHLPMHLICFVEGSFTFTNYPMWEKESIKDENAPFVATT